MEAQVIKAEEFGIEEKKANEITVGLKVVKQERELLVAEFDEVSKLELTEENLPKFKELRLKIVKNRTQGIVKWHKENKDFFLTGGRFVDAIKNKEIAINERMENKLMDGEKHFENLEKERIAKLQSERVALLSEYVEDASERDLSSMESDVWAVYLSTKKQAYLDKIKAEEEIEKARLQKIEEEKAEQERIRKENEKLKKEAEERERLAKIEENKRLKVEQERKAKEEAERLERERIAKIEEDKRLAIENKRKADDAIAKAKREEEEKKQREAYESKLKAEREEKERIANELKAKQEAEQKAKEQEEANRQAELNKGDAAKVKDLIADLVSLKTKYTFKSAKYKKIYSGVCELIDKVNAYIQK